MVKSAGGVCLTSFSFPILHITSISSIGTTIILWFNLLPSTNTFFLDPISIYEIDCGDKFESCWHYYFVKVLTFVDRLIMLMCS